MRGLKRFLPPVTGATLAAVLLTGSHTLPAAEDARECAMALNRPLSEGAFLAPTFRLLSWNIQKAGNTGWSRDLRDIASDSHLVFIQEASLQAGIPDLLEQVPELAFAPGYRSDSLDTGVMTLSAATPSVECRFTALEPWLGTPKATGVTELPIAGQGERLLAINLHAVNFALGLEDFERQFADIAVLLDVHRGPVIVAGDMNTWSDSRQTLVDDLMQRHGLRPVTFEPDLRTRAFGRALDHIFVRGLRAEAAQVIPVESSDHNPLQVLLALDH